MKIIDENNYIKKHKKLLTFITYSCIIYTTYNCMCTVGFVQNKNYYIRSASLATHIANGPYNDDIGEFAGITVDTSGYYYVKFTNISSNTLVVSYVVVHDD